LQSLLAQLRPAPPTPDRITIKSNGRISLLRPEEIDWIEAADNYVNVHVGPAEHVVRETMNSIEARLPSELFVRISRSCLVNSQRVRALQPGASGTYDVLLSTGVKLSASRTHRAAVARLLGKE
jgi:two-component system LytT family response regulator